MGRREDGGIGRVAPHLDRWVKTEGRNEETGNAGRNRAAPRLLLAGPASLPLLGPWLLCHLNLVS